MCGIYKIENLINGKVYIGKSVNIQRRFKSHISDSFNNNKPSYNHLIHKAIRKYGVENFLFEVIEEYSEDDLNQKEIYWISVYDCCILNGNNKGYNMTRGGDGGCLIDTNKAYELWDAGLSISEIAKLLNCDRHSVSIRIKEYENYSLEENKNRHNNLNSKLHKKAICQYSLSGELIKEYESILDAAERTGINYRTICSNLQGKSKSAGGFQWAYKNDQPPTEYAAKRSGDKKPVLQFNLQNEFIAEYKSVTAAIKAVGLLDISSITVCCNNPNRTAAGYYWRWKEQESEAN